MTEEISIYDVEQELADIWKGSGYQIKSIIKYLRDDLQLAHDTCIASELGRPYVLYGKLKEGYFVFNIDMSGYEILVKWEGIKR